MMMGNIVAVWWQVMQYVVLTCGVITIAIGIYNRFFHALAKHPGPTFWAITRLPYCVSIWRGTLHFSIQELHVKYGPVVRIAPDEISIIDEAVWKDVYCGWTGNKGYPKSNVVQGAQGFQHNLIAGNDADHSRFRRLMANSFSERAVRIREDILQKYVLLMISKMDDQLREYQSTKPVGPNQSSPVFDMTEWLNFTTFDITGELAFTEDFSCLRNNRVNPWVKMIFGHLKASALSICFRFYSPLDEILMSAVPKSLLELREQFVAMSRQKVHNRMARGSTSDIPDFMEAALNTGEKEAMTLQEIDETFTTIIIGGSETTATTLVGIFNYLCRNPDVKAKLIAEVRAVQSSEPLTLEQVTHLPFLNGVIQEGLRLCVPLPAGLTRVIPKGGATVCGQYLPEGTSVAIPQYAAYRAPSMFAQPDSFIPERWLSVSEGRPEEFAHDQKGILQPFFVGGRGCLGQSYARAEMRLVLAHFFRKFDVLPVSRFEWGSQKSYFLWQKERFEVRLVRAEE